MFFWTCVLIVCSEFCVPSWGRAISCSPGLEEAAKLYDTGWNPACGTPRPRALLALNTRGCWLLCGDFCFWKSCVPVLEWEIYREICCPDELRAENWRGTMKLSRLPEISEGAHQISFFNSVEVTDGRYAFAVCIPLPSFFILLKESSVKKGCSIIVAL